MNQLADGDLSPESRVKPDARGTAVTSRGHEWLLADYVPAFEPLWDRLFDSNMLAPRYDPFEVQQAAFRLLWANYELTPDEGVGLVRDADAGRLVAAVEAALFGPEKVHRTYSDWVTASLRSNGLDPDALPARDVRAVLDLLARTGRTVPCAAYVSSAEAAALFAGMA